MPRRPLRYLFALACLLLGLRFLYLQVASPDDVPHEAPTPLLLVSLDGFRPDYLDRYDAPTLRRLAEEGVWAKEGMIAAFPTKTFPNHYTQVTGLHPGRHGIVSNTIYDPVRDAWFRMGDRDAVQDARWWGGEPIWVTAEKQGLKTAPFFWPGSEAPIGGIRPAYWMPFDNNLPNADRVDQVLAWLDLPPTQRPAFLTLYFSTVDSKGHDDAPESEAVARAVAEVDRHLARLVEALQQREILDSVNLLIVSDHGMTATSAERVIALDDYIDLSNVQIVDYTPVAMLRPEPGRLETVYAALKDAHPHLQVYRKEDTPEAWHYREHVRIPALLAVADEGWSITGERARFTRNPERYNGGTHGYDNRLVSMRALFIAHGPAFRQGLRVPPFENVHLYNLMADLLGLAPAPNDGDPEAVQSFLKDEE